MMITIGFDGGVKQASVEAAAIPEDVKKWLYECDDCTVALGSPVFHLDHYLKNLETVGIPTVSKFFCAEVTL